MQLWIRLLLALLALTASGGLRAQACGTLLVSSVTLTRDMDCRGFPYAFKAIRDGVVVSLNGKIVRGDPDVNGVVVAGVRGVTVRGPGRLSGLRRAVAGTRSDSLTVSRVDIDSSTFGVELLSSRGGRVEYVRFTGNGIPIEIRQPAAAGGVAAGGHVVYSNTFSRTDFYGLRVCGADAGDNLVTGNSFEVVEQFSLEISHEASRNRIQNNKFRSGAWLGLRSTHDNLVTGNLFERDSRGIVVSPLPPSDDCYTRRGDAKASGNQLLKNLFYDTLYPIVLGSSRVGTFVSSNRIGDNRIERAEIGITLHPSTYGNDATGNVYIGVTTPVADSGVGNIY